MVPEIVFGELYVNESPYEFSINYPPNWEIEKSYDFLNYGVTFSDDYDWKSYIKIFFVETDGNYGNNQEIMNGMVDTQNETCDNLSFQIDGMVCENLEVIDVYPETINGKRAFTIIYSNDMQYSDPNYPGTYSMISTTTYIIDGNAVWQIISESEEFVFERYSYDIANAIQSFKTGSTSVTYGTPTSGTSYKIYFEELPSWAIIDINQMIKSSSEYWEKRDGIKFERVYNINQADVQVGWTKNFGHTTVGYQYVDLIQLGLGDDACIGIWQPFSQNTVSDIFTHELGHFLGYEHTNDVSDIMYAETVTSYEYLYYQDDSMIGYTIPYPVCSFYNGITYDYQFTSNTNHRYDLFYVPSTSEYEKFLNGENFRKTCHKSNFSSTDGSCKTNIDGHFVVHVTGGNSNELANFEFIISESNVPSTSQEFLPPITTNYEPPTQKDQDTIYTNQEFFQVSSNEFTTISISGFVPDEIFHGQYPVYLTISFGGKVLSELKVPTTTDGYFNVPFQLPPNSPEGTYLISGKNKGVSIGSTTFTLSSSNIVIPPTVIQHEILSEQPGKNLPSIDSFTTYSNSQNGFTVDYPENWIYEENYECYYDEPCMLSLVDNSDYWTVEVDVNFIKNGLGGYMYSNDKQYLSDYAKLSQDECINSLEIFGTQCSNYELIYSKTRMIDGLKAYEIQYSWKETYSDGSYENFITTMTEIPQGNDIWQIYSESIEEYSSYNYELIEKTIDSLKITNAYAQDDSTEIDVKDSPQIQCGEGTVLKNGKCEIFTETKSPNANSYYNSDYSFSVEPPNGWNVDEMITGEIIVQFRDGSEECVSIVGIDCLWNTNISIIKYFDLGEKLSDAEERQWQINAEKELCEQASFESEGYTCRDLRVVEKLPSTITSDGYPVITTVFSMIKNYPDDFSSDLSMIITSSLIYVENDVWEIYSESDIDVYDKHRTLIQNTINTFRHPVTLDVSPETLTLPQVEDTETNGGGCLIATATYDSELSPQVQKLREIRDSKLLQTESGTQFMGMFNSFYYSFSPYIADYERENPVFKEMVKIGVTPLLTTLSLMDYADSESSVLGIGISLIVLNGLMYVGVPVIGIIVIRRF